jgi:hypothetical protein
MLTSSTQLYDTTVPSGRSTNVKLATIIIQNAVRVLGLILIILGILFWSGHAFNLVLLHMRLGETLCGLLILLVIFGILARLNLVLTVIAIVWAFVVVIFGMRMGQLVPGPAHELIRVLHFLFGLIAIGLSESLAARIKRKFPA